MEEVFDLEVKTFISEKVVNNKVEIDFFNEKSKTRGIFNLTVI